MSRGRQDRVLGLREGITETNLRICLQIGGESFCACHFHGERAAVVVAGLEEAVGEPDQRTGLDGSVDEPVSKAT